MNERYPNATREQLEISGDPTCIICREPMVYDDVLNRPQRMVPKRLPCGHILHFHCLRAWLERQQTCPTCRRSVLESLPVDNNNARPPQTHNQPQNAGPPPVGENGAPIRGASPDIMYRRLRDAREQLQTVVNHLRGSQRAPIHTDGTTDLNQPLEGVDESTVIDIGQVSLPENYQLPPGWAVVPTNANIQIIHPENQASFTSRQFTRPPVTPQDTSSSLDDLKPLDLDIPLADYIESVTGLPYISDDKLEEMEVNTRSLVEERIRILNESMQVMRHLLDVLERVRIVQPDARTASTSTDIKNKKDKHPQTD
jgi:hypothetical protein